MGIHGIVKLYEIMESINLLLVGILVSTCTAFHIYENDEKVAGPDAPECSRGCLWKMTKEKFKCSQKYPQHSDEVEQCFNDAEKNMITCNRDCGGWDMTCVRRGFSDLFFTTKKCEHQYLTGQISQVELMRCGYAALKLYSDTYDECVCEMPWCNCDETRGVVCYKDET